MIRLFLFVFFVSSSAWARGPIVFDLNVFYFTDDMKTTSTVGYQRTFLNGILGVSIDNKGRYQLGWNYSSYSTSDKEVAGTETYASSQMGPGFIWYLDKGRSWRWAFAYNLVTTADYEPAGGTSEEWRGTGMQSEFGYQFPLTEMLMFGLRFSYSTTSYSEKITTTTKTDISYSRGHMYPSVALTAEF